MLLASGRSRLRPDAKSIVSAIQGPQEMVVFVRLFPYYFIDYYLRIIYNEFANWSPPRPGVSERSNARTRRCSIMLRVRCFKVVGSLLFNHRDVGKHNQNIYSTRTSNRPFPSSLVPLFQSESKCETILMKMSLICMKMKQHAELIFIRMVSHLDSF